ncbi:Ribosomal RNA small subunit methyltransferase B [Tepidimonas alkaliphilus]|uniref:Ribosomal RNA small subunit methyltransferase B n=1 Tax=Tepidimonas alkaliphilus TaxID=2588942 RepID=A0A554W5P8_9BURK|nr:RsmB/NOP family class I SAM-dependent RNA methyltransferase [Tepidimonas alkaliphilus]TSE18884.1 Ribosomal RNA small subunit methyltransferase B [Tepidimonas alkaliphilus]
MSQARASRWRRAAPPPAPPLQLAAQLLQQTLAFRQPPDAVLAQTLGQGPRRVGSRLRQALGDTLYAALRALSRWHGLARRLSGRPAAPLELAALRADAQACRAVMALAWPASALEALRDADPAAAQEVQRLQAQAARVDLTGAAPCERWGLPAWLIERLQPQLATSEWPLLVQALQTPAPVDLRVNALQVRREQALAALQALGLPAEPTPYAPHGLRLPQRARLAGLPPYEQGWVEVQDEGSQLIVALVGARRGETVVDFCAGAGGKTLALGAQMRDEGRLYAFDVSARRLLALTPRLARAGLTLVVSMQIADERDERLDRLSGKVDRVLVDAPCTGNGTLRRHPELAWRHDPASVAQHAELQRRILAAAARLVRPGGRLVYATCSLLPEENESVAADFDALHGSRFQRLPALDLLQEARVPKAADLVQGPYLRLWPHRHGCDGFFAAVWQRRA